MFETTALLVFMSAALILLVTPGPAVLFIVARSIEQGRAAGVTSAFGVATAGVMHVVFAAVGLSALIAQSALAFALVKYIGAAYLVYLGIRTLSDKSEPTQLQPVSEQPLGRIFWQGFIVNLFNPKTALFFLSFLPQFVDPTGNVTLQVVVLGAIFVAMAILSDSAYALAAGSVRSWLAGNVKMLRRQKQLSGTVYIALGLLTAVGARSE